MQHGHDPREVQDYAWRDIELLLTLVGERPDLTALFGGT